MTAKDRIDPELRDALSALPIGPNGIFDVTDIAATRAAVRAFAAEVAAAMPDLPDVEAEDRRIEVDGREPVTVRMVKPVATGAPPPLLVWFHGGGQVLGYAAQDDPILKRLASEVGCVIASVEYRLAPEHPSPAAAEDGVVAFRWLQANAPGLGIDAGRIAIAGQSGGGCVAAATTLMLRDRGFRTPLFQALLYPMLDDRNETPSSHEITDIGIWDRRTNLIAWRAVLGVEPGSDGIPAYAAPARATDFSGLPSAFVAVGSLDVFRDEDVAYATHLLQAGIDTELHVFPGAFHAFDLFAPNAASSKSLQQLFKGFLKKRFAMAA